MTLHHTNTNTMISTNFDCFPASFKFHFLNNPRRGDPQIISIDYRKKDITPLLAHWSYVFLALTHRYRVIQYSLVGYLVHVKQHWWIWWQQTNDAILIQHISAEITHICSLFGISFLEPPLLRGLIWIIEGTWYDVYVLWRFLYWLYSTAVPINLSRIDRILILQVPQDFARSYWPVWIISSGQKMSYKITNSHKKTYLTCSKHCTCCCSNTIRQGSLCVCACPANERRRYNVTSSVIGWALHAPQALSSARTHTCTAISKFRSCVNTGKDGRKVMLTYWGWGKMADILAKTFSNAYS